MPCILLAKSLINSINTGAQMLGSIYGLTQKLFFYHIFGMKKAGYFHIYM